MKTIKLQLEELTCPSCITNIEKELSNTKGIDTSKVLFNSSKVKVTYREEEVTKDELVATIEKLGYPVVTKKVLI